MVNLSKVKSTFKAVTKWDYEGTLRKVKDTTNFEIDKSGRYAARFFQVALALISYYWLGSQNSDFVQKFNLVQVNSAIIFFAVVSPVISGLMILVYITPWIGKNWTSRRILAIETCCDFFMTVGWISGFIVELLTIKTGCSIDVWVDGCVQFNWLVAWIFLLFVAWSAGLVFDILAWKKGVCGTGEIDSEALLEVRRATRSRK